ncbi:hypothetical protein [Cupriavidus sp. UYPR2.512]|uniref:hypothetical protein n=1 Tax=Cupriavidus sp. UYPR2.512 TaxID=1080187 RepID=UPI00037119EA|nr:hypothetical protein [Cupriavidus sp. UYPR2.512]UIF86091.1 hypothetical protein KAF44_19055 [Cupriavidus necator]
MKLQNVELDRESAKSVRAKLASILTATEEEVSQAIKVDPTQAADIADAMEAVTLHGRSSREWLGQTLASLPVECWTKEGELFGVTPTRSASLRHLILDQMKVPDSEKVSAVENRKLLIDSLRSKLPSVPSRFTPMFTWSNGPASYPVLEDVALTRSIEKVEQAFYLTYGIVEQEVRSHLDLDNALAVPTPINFIQSIAQEASHRVYEKLESLANGPDEEVLEDNLVARVLCNLAANRVLLESARIGALATKAAEVNATLIGALNKIGTLDIPQFNSVEQIEYALTLLFGANGAFAGIEGMSRRLSGTDLEATVRAAHVIQDQYLHTRGIPFRHALPDGKLTLNDTFLFALALAGLFQTKTYVPSELPNEDNYASFPGRGTPGRSGFLKPHAMELVKSMYGQMAFSNEGWELRSDRIGAYARAMDDKRRHLQMLLFRVFKRWTAGKLSNLHCSLEKNPKIWGTDD